MLNLLQTQSEGFYMCNFHINITTQSKAYYSQILDWYHRIVHFMIIFELISSCNQFELYERSKFNQFIS